jgi:uncharacterized membrane protein YfcA
LSGLDPWWLVLAGIGGGLAGSMAGLASLVSYPALLAVGLPPLTANMTNTVALVCSSVGSVWGSRPELAGRRPRVVRLGGIAIAGGITGGVLLLLTPSSVFARIAPWMIGLASAAILFRRDRVVPARGAHYVGWTVTAGVFAIAVYGGYFGAAAGVLLLALLLHTTDDTLPEANAIKNVTLGLANGVAAVAFLLFGTVQWSAALPLAAGFLIGGRIGPVLVRRAPAATLRLFIGCAGIGLAVHLGLDAYR